MTRATLLATALAALCLARFPSPAEAVSDGALSIEVLVGGSPLREHRARGTTYVEARENREYSVRLTNHQPVRVAVAISVDGRNTIDAKRTSARDARKWILGPHESIVLEGWQVSDGTARRFTFTTESDSYAAWLGDVSNAGIIEAVAYRERAPVDAWISRAPARPPGEAASDAARAEGAAGAGSRQAEAPPSAKAQSRDSDDRAATGIGRETDHRVVRVDFDSESQPSGHVRIRYGYRDELVELGVLPRPVERGPLPRRESANGFTDGPWCPSPR